MYAGTKWIGKGQAYAFHETCETAANKNYITKITIDCDCVDDFHSDSSGESGPFAVMEFTASSSISHAESDRLAREITGRMFRDEFAAAIDQVIRTLEAQEYELVGYVDAPKN